MRKKIEQDMAMRILTDQDDGVFYNRTFHTLTGSVPSAILLYAILKHAYLNDFRPFLKFKEPCSHHLYTEGESWVEELGFSNRMFDNALKKIATKSNTTTWKSVFNTGTTVQRIVTYWTDFDRVTWYTINRDLLIGLLIAIEKGKN